MKHAGQMPQEKKRPDLTRVLIVLVLAGAGMLVCAGFLWLLYGSVARDKILNANDRAERVKSSFCSAVNDLDREEKLPKHSGEIITGECGGEYPPDSVSFLMQRYDRDDRGYYVIVTDRNWHVQYALWSQYPIPPEQIHAYTPEEQNRFMKDLFAPHGGLIGYAIGEVTT